MNRFLTLIVAMSLIIGGCATPQRSAGPTASASSPKLLGNWEGIAPDKSKVGYLFRNDGTVLWKISGNPSIRARYEVHHGEEFMGVDIFDFAMPNFEGVRFLGIAKVDEEKMLFYGIPSKGGRAENGTLATRPKTFGADAITFFRVSRQ